MTSLELELEGVGEGPGGLEGVGRLADDGLGPDV